MAADPLSQTFAALASPVRRAILARLAEGEATVNEIAAPFDLTLPAISKHLKVLEQAGLISRSRDAQWRPCRLEPARLGTASEWLDRYRDAFAERLDLLDREIRRLTHDTAGQDTARHDATGHTTGADHD